MESMEITSDIEKKDILYIHQKAQKEFKLLSGNSLLLTGANGFLGYYFTKAILSWNDTHAKNPIRLYALSTFRNGVPSWINKLKKRSDFILLKKDISLYTIPKHLEFSYIIHGASIASPTFYRSNPIETINANVLGMYNILDYLLKRKKTKNPVKGLLFFSTSEIYGDPTKGNIPTAEEYRGNVSCTGPRACYDESKRFCETLCVNYSRVHNLPITIARPFNNYGPGLKLHDKRVIPDFSNNVLHNKDIVMFSDGLPTRTFCYVSDAIVGYLKILTMGKPGESYNIGVEKPEISMYNLAEKIKKIAQKKYGYKGNVIIKKSTDKEYLTDNPSRRCPKIEKAKKDLDFKPEILLDQGLENMLAWYKEQL
jgi:UDP-glucuronate decarboxylase